MSARHIWLGLSLMLGLAWGPAQAQTPQLQVIYVQQGPAHVARGQSVPVQVVPVQAVTVPTAPIEAVPVDGVPIQGTLIQPVPYETLPVAPPARGVRLASWPLFGADGSKREALNRRGYCCDSHIDGYGCQNWRTQCQFVFGSCRSFFGEPCRPAAPLLQNHRLFGGGMSGGDCAR
jgi:hypothetical protein